MAKTTYSREELERQLSESRREFWAADATINNLELKLTDMAAQLTTAESKCAALAAENVALKESERAFDAMCAEEFGPDWVSEFTETPATDAFLAEVRAQGVEMFGNLTIKIGEEEGDEDIVYAGKQALLYADQIRKGGNQ